MNGKHETTLLYETARQLQLLLDATLPQQLSNIVTSWSLAKDINLDYSSFSYLCSSKAKGNKHIKRSDVQLLLGTLSTRT